jgi:hypothetical protein
MKSKKFIGLVATLVLVLCSSVALFAMGNEEAIEGYYESSYLYEQEAIKGYYEPSYLYEQGESVSLYAPHSVVFRRTICLTEDLSCLSSVLGGVISVEEFVSLTWFANESLAYAYSNGISARAVIDLDNFWTTEYCFFTVYCDEDYQAHSPKQLENVRFSCVHVWDYTVYLFATFFSGDPNYCGVYYTLIFRYCRHCPASEFVGRGISGFLSHSWDNPPVIAYIDHSGSHPTFCYSVIRATFSCSTCGHSYEFHSRSRFWCGGSDLMRMSDKVCYTNCCN